MSEVVQDLTEALRRRDDGIAGVMSHEGTWREQCYARLELLEDSWRGTGEDLRIRLLLMGVKEPHHHNAWGGMVRGALDIGLLSQTGEMAHMQTPKSHGRMSPVYAR